MPSFFLSDPQFGQLPGQKLTSCKIKLYCTIQNLFSHSGHNLRIGNIACNTLDSVLSAIGMFGFQKKAETFYLCTHNHTDFQRGIAAMPGSEVAFGVLADTATGGRLKKGLEYLKDNYAK